MEPADVAAPTGLRLQGLALDADGQIVLNGVVTHSAHDGADGASGTSGDLSDDPSGDPSDDDSGGGSDGDDETGRLIRPYAITRGRTGSDGPDIHLESQVVATPVGTAATGTHRWESARVIELTKQPMALVEIAARLEVPIGVARVLVADLVDDGSVTIHLPDLTTSFTSLLERVLDGVRQL